MRSKKPNTNCINDGPAQIRDPLPFLVAPPHISPGEVAAISIGRRVLKGTGAPGDYFGEIIDLAKESVRFLQKFEPEQITPRAILSFTESPEGLVEWAYAREGVASAQLTLTGLLKRVLDPDTKNKKLRTFSSANHHLLKRSPIAWS